MGNSFTFYTINGRNANVSNTPALSFEYNSHLGKTTNDDYVFTFYSNGNNQYNDNGTYGTPVFASFPTIAQRIDSNVNTRLALLKEANNSGLLDQPAPYDIYEMFYPQADNYVGNYEMCYPQVDNYVGNIDDVLFSSINQTDFINNQNKIYTINDENKLMSQIESLVDMFEDFTEMINNYNSIISK